MGCRPSKPSRSIPQNNAHPSIRGLPPGATSLDYIISHGPRRSQISKYEDLEKMDVKIN